MKISTIFRLKGVYSLHVHTRVPTYTLTHPHFKAIQPHMCVYVL